MPPRDDDSTGQFDDKEGVIEQAMETTQDLNIVDCFLIFASQL